MLNKIGAAVKVILTDLKVIKANISALQNLPKPKDGHSPDINLIIDKVLARIPAPIPGKDGTSPDADAVAFKVLEQIPKPKDGKPGKDATAPPLTDIVNAVLAEIPTPKDGTSPDVDAITNMVLAKIPAAQEITAQEGKQGKQGKAGAGITKVKLEKGNKLAVWIDGVRRLVGTVDIPKPAASFTPNSGGGSGGKPTPTLQQVTDKGNTTDNPIILQDKNKAGRGLIGADENFGVLLAGRDQSLERTPVTIDGSTNLLSSEQLAVVFNGAANGDFLRLTTKTDINGQDVFLVGSTPLDVVEYSEEFTNSGPDTTLTSSYQEIIAGTTANQYRTDTSQAITTFKLFNNDKKDAAEVEFYVTVNGAPPTPDDLQIVTVPKDNGEYVVNFDDTVQTTVNPGDVVSVHVRQLTGKDGEVSVLSSEYTTILTMVQNASLQNAIQSFSSISSGGPINARRYYRITENGVYNLPPSSTLYDENNPFLLAIANDAGEQVSINIAVGDVLKTTSGDALTLNIPAGATYILAAGSTNEWFIVSSYADIQTKVIKSLPLSQTNADYDVSPIVKLSDTFSLGYINAEVELNFEAASDAQNRSVVVGLFIDGNLIDEEFSLEPKDSSNNPYSHKKIDYNFTTGSHTIEVRYGKRGGVSSSFVEVKNVRIFVRPL